LSLRVVAGFVADQEPDARDLGHGLGYHTELRPATRASVVLLPEGLNMTAPTVVWRPGEWDNGGSNKDDDRNQPA
jgi:hypothetical protein